MKLNEKIGSLRMRWLICLPLLSLTSFSAFAQREEQLWLDFQVSYPFGGRYLLENTTSYSTLVNPEDKWRSLSVSPTFEMVLVRWLDLVTELGVAYTTQQVNKKNN